MRRGDCRSFATCRKLEACSCWARFSGMVFPISESALLILLLLECVCALIDVSGHHMTISVYGSILFEANDSGKTS